jgi:NTF2 fold immunity protein
VSAQDPWKQPNGLVPDKETAIRIAEAVLIPIYGEEQIKREKPYNVRLEDGKWTVTGSMPKSESPIVGGTFFIIISQKDARIIDIGHFL